MEDIEEKLEEDAERLAAFGQEHEYVIDAIYNVLGKRIEKLGYVDGSFVLKATGRGQYSSQLKGSPFQELFSKNCVPSENIDIMLDYLENVIRDPDSLSALEEEALVFWLFLPYLSLTKRSKRKPYMLSILKRILAVRTGEDIWERKLRISETIIFDSNVCSVEIISSVETYAKYTFELKMQNEYETLFYRGHSRLDYLLQPGIMREPGWLRSEAVMYQELLVRCAQDFAHCQTHLDYLVEMQHYGLPTRLLDITENPLVALYFASCNNVKQLGEVVVLSTGLEKVRYAKSDNAAILAALPTLSYMEQRRLYRLCTNGCSEAADPEYKTLAGKLAAEIKSRNPAFEPRIKKADLLGHVFVTPIRSNQRIVKQDGSFIICGLSRKNGEDDSLEELRCLDEEGKKVIFVVSNKEKIMSELDTLSINRATLFPEIDDVAEYIKGKYKVES